MEDNRGLSSTALTLGTGQGLTTGKSLSCNFPLGLSEVAQSCLTLCNLMDCSPPGSSVHGILQARILGCHSGLPFSSPGDLPNPGIEPRSPAMQADALTSEPPGKLLSNVPPSLLDLTAPNLICFSEIAIL